MKVYVIGIGLIGGSMALDIQALDKDAVIIGVDAIENHLNQALELGIIHQKAKLKEVIDADFVIVAVPVDTALELLPKVLHLVSEDTLVFDVGSTKSPICEAMVNHPKRRNFLATHPIAGTEFSGPKAAIRNLFIDKTNIICEVEKTTFKSPRSGLYLRNSRIGCDGTSGEGTSSISTNESLNDPRKSWPPTISATKVARFRNCTLSPNIASSWVPTPRPYSWEKNRKACA